MLLGWFKYYEFFSESLKNSLADIGIDAPVPLLQITLPIGISFFTFQAISYLVDISRGQIKPMWPLDFATYLSFFPHLVAGPIVRASEFAPQLEAPPRPDRDPGDRRALPHFDGAVQEGRDLVLPGDGAGRSGLRAAGRAQLARDPRRDLRLRRPDLRRLQRLHRHRDRLRAPAGDPVPAELQQPVPVAVPAGLLAALAHDALPLAARLSVHPPGRFSRVDAVHLPEPDDHHAPGRALAWGRLDLRRLGGHPRHGPHRRAGPDRPRGALLVRAGRSSGGGSSPSTSSAWPGSSSGRSRSRWHSTCWAGCSRPGAARRW